LPPKIQITTIRRLIAATTQLDSSHVVEQQVRRIQERLDRGVDLEGQAFAPYKYPERQHDNDRPLQRASRLFESPTYTVDHEHGGTNFSGKIYGLPAKIAFYQNRMRKFVGYSRQDKEDAKENLMQSIADAFHRWRR
jgi:hypothetical protein